MNVYSAKQIRNIAVLGHGGAGKTTLVESLAFLTGLTSRMGKVTDGNTISDFDKEEQKRQFSIDMSVVPIEHNGIKFNFGIEGLQQFCEVLEGLEQVLRHGRLHSGLTTDHEPKTVV